MGRVLKIVAHNEEVKVIDLNEVIEISGKYQTPDHPTILTITYKRLGSHHARLQSDVQLNDIIQKFTIYKEGLK